MTPKIFAKSNVQDSIHWHSKENITVGFHILKVLIIINLPKNSPIHAVIDPKISIQKISIQCNVQ